MRGGEAVEAHLDERLVGAGGRMDGEEDGTRHKLPATVCSKKNDDEDTGGEMRVELDTRD